MSLLSRTLQSILSKYILDVDVEGIALPSLFVSSSTTSGSNHNSMNGSGGGASTTSPGSNDSNSNDSGWGVRLSNVKLREGVQLMVLPGKLRRENGNVKKKRSNDKQKRRTTPEAATQNMRPTNQSAGGEVHYDDETDNTETLSTSYEPQETKAKPVGWFASWFRTTTTATHDDDQQKLLDNNDNQLQDVPPSLSTSTVDNNSNYNTQNRNLIRQNRNDTFDESYPYEPADDNQTTASFADDDEDHDNISSGDSDEDSDEIDHSECPLILKLGRDGTIGILDVRLVGKTIHVMIEDADLTIEVERQSANIGTDASTLHQHQQQQQQQAAAKKKATPDLPPTLKTTGDRVLAENIIARYLSIIPNLFLRDIRVRLIIHNDVTGPSQDCHGGSDSCSHDDTIIEVVIGLFSVNDGKDFLLNFAGEVDNEVDEDDGSTSSTDQEVDDSNINASTSGEWSTSGRGDRTPTSATTANASNNEFLTKRIRTGRGPEGGIVLRIYPSSQQEHLDVSNASREEPTDSQWANETWQRNTEYEFVRCSGLDLQAQVFLGTKKEIAINNYGYYAEEMQYDNFTVDAMLFGVDYIVPGPQPPLPKFSNVQQGLPKSLSSEEVWARNGVTTFVADANGIQSCRIASPFHKVARGLIPIHCSGSHLPCEACHRCWSKEGGAFAPHTLDGSTPLGGFIVHAAVRDSLSLNVDRYNLTVLGKLISIFTKPMDVSKSTNGELHGSNNSTAEIPVESGHSVKSQSSLPSAFGSIDDSGRSATSGRRILKSLSMKKLDEVSLKSAYPTYMKPEKIQFAGLHIADLRIRVHILRQRSNLEYGRSYCYWDVCAKCGTMDLQLLSASERPFRDLRLDVAHLTVHQHKGVETKQIISLGVRPNQAEFDDAVTGPFVNKQASCTRSPWPTTAAAIMDIMPPLESMVYANREHHGLQLRLLSVVDISESVDRCRNDINIRVGTAHVDVEFKIKDELMIVVSEGTTSVLGPHKAQSPPSKKPSESILRYKVISDGGRIDLKPIISATLLRTVSQGEISKHAGFSIECFLDKFRVAYGKPTPIRVLDHGLSLKQLASLPDNVRLRVLLFLKDLKPLEAAFGLPGTPNSFMRCRAVNTGIVQIAESHRSLLDASNKYQESRRQALVGELLMLDDDTLDDLLATHRRANGNNVG